MKWKPLQVAMFAGTLIISTGLVYSDKNGPNGDYTGAPLSNGNQGNTCATSSCHTGSNDNGANLSVWVTKKDSSKAETFFEANTTYTVHVQVSGNGNAKTFGYSSQVLNTFRGKTGTTTANAGSKIGSFINRNIAEHTAPSASGTFTYNWTSPSSPTDSVTIYTAGNATNGLLDKVGDQIVLDTLVLPLKTVVGVKIRLPENTIEVFPNPTTDQLGFNRTVSKVVLYNTVGKKVFESQNSSKISIGHLRSGSYLLKLTDGNRISSHRISKR